MVHGPDTIIKYNKNKRYRGEYKERHRAISFSSITFSISRKRQIHNMANDCCYFPGKRMICYGFRPIDSVFATREEGEYEIESVCVV